MTPCDAVIFDFDGVILESEDIKTRAFEALYREHGTAVVEAVVAHHKAHGGISRRKKIRHCHRTLLGVELAVDALDAMCARFSDLVEDAVVACDWVPGAQSVLAAQSTLRPLFVVSGTPQDELTRIVARRGLSGFFVEVWGSPPEKPPIIRGILDRHALDAGSVVFIGDSTTDFDAASETGLRFVGRVARGRTSLFPPGTQVVRDLTQICL
jgi:phosphoglycolate phosphatase-like HAD superfamily hydrolase